MRSRCHGYYRRILFSLDKSTCARRRSNILDHRKWLVADICRRKQKMGYVFSAIDLHDPEHLRDMEYLVGWNHLETIK